MVKKKQKGGNSPTAPNAPASNAPAPNGPAPNGPPPADLPPGAPDPAELGAVETPEAQIREKHAARRKEYKQNKAKKEAIQKAKDLEQAKKDMESGDVGVKLILKKLARTLSEFFQGLKSGFIGFIIIPILFASIAPALPLFVFMAGLFATIKYFMGYLKKL